MQAIRESRESIKEQIVLDRFRDNELQQKIGMSEAFRQILTTEPDFSDEVIEMIEGEIV